jgi:AraC-like DNA-binding protein
MSRSRQRLTGGTRSPAYPESGIQVRPFAVGFTKGFDFRPGPSEWHGLFYASAGVMSVRTADGYWIVPPQRAVWMPAGTECRVEVCAGLDMRTLYFHPRATGAMPKTCAVANVPPLLRELILHTVGIGMLNRTIPEHARLIGVLVDQLRVLQVAPLQLPQPADARAVRVAAHLARHPGSTDTLAALARRAGASPRTIERLFRAETNLSFGKWREQLRLLHALRLLAGGQPVTNVALDLGYGSSSAFIAMFKRAFGTTPSRYYVS